MAKEVSIAFNVFIKNAFPYKELKIRSKYN